MKKLFIYFIFGLMLSIITACGISKTDYDKLVNENEVLKKESVTLKNQIDKLNSEIDEIKNGADRISKKIEISYAEKDYSSVVSYFEELKQKHPTALEVEKNLDKYKNSKAILTENALKAKVEEEKKLKEKLEQEKKQRK